MVDTSELERIYEKYNSHERQYLYLDTGDDKLTFTVKHRLNTEEITSITEYVCDRVVNEMTSEYHPELKDLCLRTAVIRTYTDICLPQDDNCLRLVYGTPIFAMITGHYRRPVVFDGRDYDENMVIDVEQYEQIIAAIDQKIAYTLTRLARSESPIRKE